jgi:peptidoglycan hydrolase CwlO-like protein
MGFTQPPRLTNQVTSALKGSIDNLQKLDAEVQKIISEYDAGVQELASLRAEVDREQKKLDAIKALVKSYAEKVESL